jgi:SAM-dependent methyltransferase
MVENKQYFATNWIEIFFNPSYVIRKQLLNAIKKLAPQLRGTIVDLGCGTKPYEKYFNNASHYIGVDIEVSGNTAPKDQIDVFYDGKHLPFEDCSIDNVFSSEVFEHVFDLELLVPEINRVIKKGGYLLASCPFAWPEHEQPYDYARYTSFGIKHLLEKNSFKIVEQCKTGNYLSSLLQLISIYIYFFTAKIPILKYFLFLIFITPLSLLSILFSALLPNRILRNDLYMNNVILAQKI